jgi:hypothetical protein
MTNLKKRLLTLATAALGLIAPMHSAHAVLQLAGDVVGSFSFCGTDQVVAGLCPVGAAIRLADLSAVPGVLDLGGFSLGGLSFAGSLHIQTLGPAFNVLNSSSLSITNTTGSTVNARVAVSATGYTPPAVSASTSGSGTWNSADGSSIIMSWYNDPANAQGADSALDFPGLLLDSFSDTAVGAADSFTHNGSSVVSDLAPFSMTVAFDLTLTPGGQLQFPNQSLVKPTAVLVPEPATLLLLATAVALVGWRCRRPRVPLANCRTTRAD